MSRYAMLLPMIAAILFVSSSGALQQRDPKKDKDDKALTKEDEKYRGGVDQAGFCEKWTSQEGIKSPYLTAMRRGKTTGSVGATRAGVATLELYQNTANRTQWAYAVCNRPAANSEPSYGDRGGNRTTPRGTERHSRRPGRLRMARNASLNKQLLEVHQPRILGRTSRFELSNSNGRTPTRKMTAASKGALYILANGTNRIIVLIEARIIQGWREAHVAVWSEVRPAGASGIRREECSGAAGLPRLRRNKPLAQHHNLHESSEIVTSGWYSDIRGEGSRPASPPQARMACELSGSAPAAARPITVRNSACGWRGRSGPEGASGRRGGADRRSTYPGALKAARLVGCLAARVANLARPNRRRHFRRLSPRRKVMHGRPRSVQVRQAKDPQQPDPRVPMAFTAATGSADEKDETAPLAVAGADENSVAGVEHSAW